MFGLGCIRLCKTHFREQGKIGGRKRGTEKERLSYLEMCIYSTQQQCWGMCLQICNSIVRGGVLWKKDFQA